MGLITQHVEGPASLEERIAFARAWIHGDYGSVLQDPIEFVDESERKAAADALRRIIAGEFEGPHAPFPGMTHGASCKLKRLAGRLKIVGIKTDA